MLLINFADYREPRKFNDWAVDRNFTDSSSGGSRDLRIGRGGNLNLREGEGSVPRRSCNVFPFGQMQRSPLANFYLGSRNS